MPTASRSTGYSGTPLAKKLGIGSGARVKTWNAPQDYLELLRPIPDRVTISTRIRTPIDVWHLFVTSKAQLETRIGQAQREIAQAGMIWVSWPKKASGVSSDMSEDVVRQVALPLGLVDVKVCAVDDTWSGLKLVIRKENRS